MTGNAERPLTVIVIGAGIGGIAAAIDLRRHGFEEITILEAAPELGGTWFHNTYPGAACDIPSPMYSFSYAQRDDWKHLCATQADILDYVREVARDHGVDRFVVPDTKVSACAWNDAAAHWRVDTNDGRAYTADAIIVATGQLHQPAMPNLPGLESFAGHSFHSARWDHEYDLRGKRVAVVGTGASAAQFVPQLAAQADTLTVFQRTGNWFLPRKNRPYPRAIKWLIGHVPGVQAVRRRFWFEFCESFTIAIRHPRTIGRLASLRSAAFMRWQIKDPDLRRTLWPDYTFGCKRILFSSHFLPALQRPNVTLVSGAVTAVHERGVSTADGAVHEVDCIIYATGFRTNDFMFPMQITGRESRSLDDAWADGARSHLGMTVPGFPSMFILYGPNTNTSAGSIIVYLEAQVAYVCQALQLVRDREAAAIDVRPDVYAASDREVQSRFAGTAWTGCDSWYRDEGGRIVANWPGSMREYIQRTEAVDPAEYTLVALPEDAAIHA